MEKENIIEILQDFIDFIKEKEEGDTEKESDTEEVEFIVPEEGDDNFNKVIDKIAKGE